MNGNFGFKLQETNIMKRYILIFLIAFTYNSYGQDYKEWDNHDVIRFYKKVELDYNSLDKDGEEIEEVYVPTKKIDDGTYEIEVKKISSKLYQISGTNIYMYFRYSPYLYSFDEGILEVSYNTGTLYEKP